MSKINRLLNRSYKYYVTGISIISLPITFLGFSRNLYSLIDNLPVFKVIFPTFQRFLWLGGFSLVPFGIFTGYLWLKSPFYRAGVDVTQRSNPFAFRLGPGRDSKMFFGQVIGQTCMLRLFKKLNVIESGEEDDYQRYLRYLEHLNSGKDIREIET